MTTTRTTKLTGHTPTLFACFAHFDVCFMLWVLIGALGTFIFDGTGIPAGLKGLLVGIPVLTGSLTRIPLGILSDRYGGRRVALGLLAFLVLPLLLGWLAPIGLPLMVVTGLTLGVAGASFAIVLPLASRWYPPERQGLVMGIAAAGNSGTVLANILAPRLALSFGWQNVFGLALIPLAAVFVLFLFAAREAPVERVATGRSSREYWDAISHPDAWWFCAFYCITFGGYVGLSSFLPVYLHDQFGMSPVTAGSLTAAAALAGSVSRPAGGYVADRLGGASVLQAVFAVVAVCYATFATAPSTALVAPLLLVMMVALGLGNGVVFQLVPQRFAKEIGSVTGVVGALGGIGGFLLPTLLGAVKQATGSYAPGFATMSTLALGAAIALRLLMDRTRAVALSTVVARDE